MSIAPDPDELDRLREQVAELAERIHACDRMHEWEIRGKDDIIYRLAVRWERATGVPSRRPGIPDNDDDTRAALRTALQRCLQLERDLEGARYTIEHLRRRQEGDRAMLRTIASVRENLALWVAHDERETAAAAVAAEEASARREIPPPPSFSTLDDAVPPTVMEE